MSSNTTAQVVRSLCTPEQHTKIHKTKPVTLLALGRAAFVEHPDGTLSRPDPLLFMRRVDSKVMEVKPA